MDEQELQTAVEDAQVPFVRIPRFGITLSSHRLIHRSRRLVARLRGRIEDRIKTRPVVTCAECDAPLYLRSSIRRRWYFQHVPGHGAACKFNNGKRSDIEDIDAYRYNGQKEGRLHREMKRLVRESLEADERFSEVREEKWWTGTYDPTARRRPDLQAKYGAEQLRIAFEMQPSSTYISVIRQRRAFYLAEGALLFWIFPRLDFELMRLYQEDVFYNNNSNLFVVDEETRDLSCCYGKLFLRCHYVAPVNDGDDIVDEWRSAIVSADQLTIEQHKQRVYFFDYEGEVTRCRAPRQRPKTKAEELQELRERFEQMWALCMTGEQYTPWHEEYARIRQRVAELQELFLPLSYDDRDFIAFVSLMLSAKRGEGVWFRHPRFISVAHTAFQYHKPFFIPFGWVCEQFGTDKRLRIQDHTGNWAKRVKEFKESVAQLDERYRPDARYSSVLGFLVPPLMGRLTAARARWDRKAGLA